MREKSKVLPGLICGDELSHIREAVCITTEKVYDACKEKQYTRYIPYETLKS